VWLGAVGIFIVTLRPAPPVWVSGGKRRNAKANGGAESGGDRRDTECGACTCVSPYTHCHPNAGSDQSADQGMAGAGRRLPHAGIGRTAHRRTPSSESRARCPPRNLGQRGIAAWAGDILACGVSVRADGVRLGVGAPGDGDRMREIVGRLRVGRRLRVRDLCQRGGDGQEQSQKKEEFFIEFHSHLCK